MCGGGGVNLGKFFYDRQLGIHQVNTTSGKATKPNDLPPLALLWEVRGGGLWMVENNKHIERSLLETIFGQYNMREQSELTLQPPPLLHLICGIDNIS